MTSPAGFHDVDSGQGHPGTHWRSCIQIVIMVPMAALDDELVAWLLEGDPSIRWRVHRDLLGSPSSTVTASEPESRRRVGRQADLAARS